MKGEFEEWEGFALPEFHPQSKICFEFSITYPGGM
jgi:hypothetical protein